MSTTTETRLDFRKLSARIGAEIRGLDLSGDLSDATIAQIREALNIHKALVFRDANVHDDDAQVRFASRFGPLTQAHPTVASVDGKPAVLPVDSENGSANTWHTDVTFVVNPPQASTLRSITLPAYGGETLIASSAAAAYRDLPEELRNFADTLWAIHTNDYDYSVPKNLEHANAEERRAEFTRLKFETAHPVVRVHPLTGERGLFIGGFAQTAADRGPVQHRIQGHPAAAAGLRHPAGERGPGELGTGPAGALRQPHHPALRPRQL